MSVLNPIEDLDNQATPTATLQKKRKYNKKFRRMAERHANKMKLS